MGSVCFEGVILGQVNVSCGLVMDNRRIVALHSEHLIYEDRG